MIDAEPLSLSSPPPDLRHPDRQLRQRAVRLADGQSDFVGMAITPRDNDCFAATRMKSVTDRHLTQLIVSTMKLLRRPQGMVINQRQAGS